MKLTALILAVLLTGCSTTRTFLQEHQSAEYTAKGVDQYGQTVPFAERLKNREAVNELTEFCDIKITCVGDPE